MKYPRAEEVGQSWQALAVESAQTELKLCARDAVLTDRPFKDVKKSFADIVDTLVDELESENLKEKCKNTLPPYALKLYAAFLRMFGIGTENNLSSAILLTADRGELGEMAAAAVRDMPPLTAREWAYNRATPLTTLYGNEVMRRIKKHLSEIVDMEPKPDYETNVNLRNVAEMEVRHLHQQKELTALREGGTRLVWIEPHANCSKRCEKYQGKLYSLDHTYGEIEGEHYEPLENATDNPADFHTTKAGITYHNGCISGFNCRHRLVPYQKGNKPATIPANIIRRQRAIEQEQRKCERSIRRAREVTKLLGGLGAGKAYNMALEKQVKLRKEYEAFCRENKVPFYRERLRILEGEQLRSTVKIPKNILSLVPVGRLGELERRKTALTRY